MQITIKEKTVELKMSFKAMIMFENITGETFKGTTITDILTYLYCIVVTSSNDYELTWEEFLAYMDENPITLQEFTKWFETSISNQNKLKKA